MIREAAVLHVTGITLALGRGPRRDRRARVAVARAAGVTVTLDLNYRLALWSAEEAEPALAAAVRQADVVFAGETEAEIVTHTADPLHAARALEAMAHPPGAGAHQARSPRVPGAHRRRHARAAGARPSPSWTPWAPATRSSPATSPS